MSNKTYLFLCLLSLFFLAASGQQRKFLTPDPFEQQFHHYKLAKPSRMLFVHFDKNIYTNNETVWFTGYLLNERFADISKHDILSVALIRDIDSTIIKQQKFFMANSVSYGSIVMPDSILAGNYHFLVTTNRVSNGVPDVSYIQPVIIKTNNALGFNASVKILTPGISGKKPTDILLNVTTPDARFLPKPVTVRYRYGQLSQKTQTNSSGELILKINEQKNLTDPNVYFKLTYGKDSSFLNLALPIEKQKAKVTFYPEGGNMVNWLPGTIGWEVKDQQLAVIALKAQLYQDDHIIDTIETNSNGIGRFNLTPKKGSIYKIKLLHSGMADSTYFLPSALDEHGLSLKAARAVVTDTLRVSLKALHTGPIFIRVHNFQETFIYNTINLKAPSVTLILALHDVPKGLNTITISDSLGRPIAERLFFAHYNPKQKISVSTDKRVYGQREKVSMSINLTNPDSLAMVSIACVQENRFSQKLSSDIESYNYLTNHLNALPPYNNKRGYEDLAYLEDVLLVKGWNRYSWPDLMKTTAADTLIKYDNTSIRLNLSEQKKTITKPIEIAILKSTGLNMFVTDEHGNFEFPNNSLAVKKEKSIYLLITDKRKDKYQIKVNDPYIKLNKNYQKVLLTNFRSIPSAIQNNRILTVKSNESVFQLKEVQIKANDNGNESGMAMGVNRCGDYVCTYNILNCRNHIGSPQNKHPIPGKSYSSDQGIIIYRACSEQDIVPGMTPMEGIYIKKEFYVNDYPDALEPAFFSTLYWNYGELLTKKTKTITFHTSDITGKFRIVVQGISSGGVRYGDYTFEVKGK